MRRITLICLYLFSFIQYAVSQTCNPISLNYTVTESRCVSTGSVTISANGGSGNYQYKLTGPLSTPFSSAATISGLPAGRYLVSVQDLQTNCLYAQDSVTIPGNYQAPSFTLIATAPGCGATADGTITVSGQTGGRAPLEYQIVAPSASGVGTVSPTGQFSGLIAGNYTIRLTDSCGAIQTMTVAVQPKGWKILDFNAFKSCDTLNVFLTLKDDDGNISPSPAFDGFLYGVIRNTGDTAWYTSETFSHVLNHKRSIKIVVKDPCGVTKTVTWSDIEIPALDPLVQVANKQCNTVTAFVTGALYLSTAQYCLFNQANVQVACNSTGMFTGIPYGSYCIKAIDLCYDTIITRCFSVAKLVPAITQPLVISTSCTDAFVSVTGQVNLSNPSYCLYTSSNVLVSCNSNGIFNAVPFGSYCIRIQNDPACYDTIISRCFTVAQPVPAAGGVAITNQTCNSFTASVQVPVNLSLPQYCLYTIANALVDCNSTGVFANLPFGSYCIDLRNNSACYDTTIRFCFTVVQPLPSVANNVSVSANDCPPFTAAITGQTGLNNPQYCLYNSNNQMLECNNTGFFTVNDFGNYCIKIQNDPACFDTVITRCFSKVRVPVNFTYTSTPSCSLIGGTDLFVDVSSGIRPYSIFINSPAGVLLASGVTSGGQRDFTFTGVSPLPGSAPYNVIVRDACGTEKLISVTPSVSIMKRTVTVTPKCPSGSLVTGSADVVLDVTNNNIGGIIRSKITKVNGVANNINGNTSGPNNYITTFPNLAPATYIITTNIKNCNKDVFDTVVVKPYQNPGLSRSAGYVCDNSSLSIGAGVTGGVAPFTYEIISNTPSLPSVIAGPQSSPLFSINNGTQYSLIRLRVLDACGNAGLNDVGVQPLGESLIQTTGFNCFYGALSLRVDSLSNTSYKWYKKTGVADSVLVGTSNAYVIPYMMPTDTGMYSCVMQVNGGCIRRWSAFRVAAQCQGLLPVAARLQGRVTDAGTTELNWTVTESINSLTWELQRSADGGTGFVTIGKKFKEPGQGNRWEDRTPPAGTVYYRLQINNQGGGMIYSNTVKLRISDATVQVYPNPVLQDLNLRLGTILQQYRLELTDLSGRMIFSQTFSASGNYTINGIRNRFSVMPGMYLLRLFTSKEREPVLVKKLLFNP